MPSPFVPNPLPQPFFNRLGSATANALPMAFKRRLGSIPSPDGPKQTLVSQDFQYTYASATSDQLCLSSLNTVHVDLLDLFLPWAETEQKTGCYHASTIGMHDLVNCDHIHVDIAPDLTGEFETHISKISALKKCDTQKYIEAVAISENGHASMSLGNAVKACSKQRNSNVIAYQEA